MNKLMKLGIMFLIIFSLTGCTTGLKDEENKAVSYNGQTLTENILCQPTNEEVKDIYIENEVNINDLPKCEDFKINSGEYESIWTDFLIKPLAWVLLKLGFILNNVGLSIIIFSILIRLAMFPLTAKNARQSENMKKAQPALKQLEEKYKNKTTQDDMMKKSQEMMAIYQKHNINPVAGCLFGFLQLPIFFAFLEAIRRVPVIFEGKFLTMDLGTTTLVGLSNGNYVYIILIILIMGTTFYSFKNAASQGNSDQQKQMQFMMKFMMIFISVVSFTLPTAIAIYWITSSTMTIIQNKFLKRSN